MTKEEIQRVLDLSLEYYKSEVFGTDKESEKPSRERIDWIYDKMTGSSEIPKDLEKAARKSAIAPFNLDIDEEHLYEYPYLPIAEQKFIEGAKWQKEQYHFFNKAWAENMQAELDRNYENGKQAMKEQMMKEAVDTVVSLDAGGFPFIEFGVGKFGLKARDKVRVIVLKVEEE
jgi:hypothetical protein